MDLNAAVAAIDLNASTGGDWRSQLPPEARHKIVIKIHDILKKHLPISVPEGLAELQRIAVRFEEKIYTAATSQADYLRKISLKLLPMETKEDSPENALHGDRDATNSSKFLDANFIYCESKSNGSRSHPN